MGTYTVLRDALSAELGLLLGEGDTSGVAAEVLRGVGDEGSPSTADVEEPISVLKRVKRDR